MNDGTIFLRTGDELTLEEKLRIAQLTAEALAHLIQAEAFLEKIQKRRQEWINTELRSKIF